MTQRKLFELPSSSKADCFEADDASWEYHYHKILASIDGTEQEKQAIVRKRILRYFGQFKLDSQSYLSIRNDVNFNLPDLQLLSSKLILYGIDFMTIERAKNYFAGFLTNIRRMDDSHFTIQFRNQAQCLTALNKHKIGKQVFCTPQQVLKHSNQGWLEMRPYYQLNFQRKLMARFATSVDRLGNICNSTQKSCSLAYSQAKRRFLKSLKQNEEARQIRRGERNRRFQRFEGQNYCQNKRRQYSQRSRSRQQKMKSCSNYKCNKFSNQKCNCQKNPRFQRSRSRSKSPLDSEMIQQPKLIANERVSESNFKFELYIKRRDQRKGDESFNTRVLSKIDMNRKSKEFMNEKSTSTNIDSCDIEVINPIKPNEGDGKLALDALNSSEMDFEQYLERMKLEDSKNDFSAFDLDIQG